MMRMRHANAYGGSLCALFLLQLAASDALAADAATAKFLGVATCSSTVCHGSVVSRDATHILQNEYRIWMDRDAHARAYSVLANERSRRIARTLGLGSPADARECLACHSIDAPAARRGEKFTLSDGVSCEACHGAAEHWIDTHEDADASHEANLARGMYPTSDPVERAALCLGCHQGSAKRFVSHAMMAAGHPRLTFELDTFTALQPAHFRVDADYRERKPAPASAATWAAGQVVAVAEYARLLASRDLVRAGTWPEFALFDCFSCHHDLGTQPPPLDTKTRGPAGLPRLGSASIPIYRALLAALAPAEQSRLDGAMAAVVEAAGRNRARLVSAAAKLGEVAASDARTVAGAAWTAAQLESLLARLVAPEAARYYRTYSDAEQATMGAQAIVATLVERNDLSGARKDRIVVALDGLFEATASEETFRPASFERALTRVRAAL